MTRDRLVPASYVVFLRDGRVLLHQRRNTGYRDGHWALVAGHVEPYEDPRAAAVREAAEEAGLRVESPVPLTTVQRRYGTDPVEQRVDFFWLARTWSGEPEVREPRKNAGFGWFGLDALPEPLVPHERVVLELLREGRVPPILCGEDLA